MNSSMSLTPHCRSQFCFAQFSRIRWLDCERRSTQFLTGSYMQQWNEIASWTLAADIEVDEMLSCVASLKVDSDVNDLKVIGNDRFVSALNSGDVLLGNCSADTIVCDKQYKDVHNGCPANAVLECENCLVSGGQDGSIVVIAMDTVETQKVITERFTSVRSLASINPHLFASSHIDGRICIWDLRNNNSKCGDPVFSCHAAKFPNATTAIAVHPAESNLIAFGTDDGEIGFLDTRGKGTLKNPLTMPFPVDSIWEVAFHPVYPNNFYIACDRGILAHLSIDSNGLSSSIVDADSPGGRTNAWLSPSICSNSANVNLLIDGSMSLNSFDICSSGIIACSDNQMVTLIYSDYSL